MDHNLEYNTAKPRLRFPEYGRMVQQMIDSAKMIVDDEERQLTVEAIVQLMYQMHPQAKMQEDIWIKIWKHVFAMADFELNVKAPEGIDVSPESAGIRPEKVAYPPTTRRMRHYGYNVGSLIQKCIDMPEGAKKEAFTETIAAYMKLAYKTWNREHYVSDDVVKDDLTTLSDGKLVLENHGSLDILANKVSVDSRGSKNRRTRGSRGGRNRQRNENNPQKRGNSSRGRRKRN
jgi:hypothetical protein